MGLDIMISDFMYDYVIHKDADDQLKNNFKFNLIYSVFFYIFDDLMNKEKELDVDIYKLLDNKLRPNIKAYVNILWDGADEKLSEFEKQFKDNDKEISFKLYNWMWNRVKVHYYEIQHIIEPYMNAACKTCK